MSSDFTKALVGLEGTTIPGDILRSIAYAVRPGDATTKEHRMHVPTDSTSHNVTLPAGVYQVKLQGADPTLPLTSESVVIAYRNEPFQVVLDGTYYGITVSVGHPETIILTAPTTKIYVTSLLAHLSVSGTLIFRRLGDGSDSTI